MQIPTCQYVLISPVWIKRGICWCQSRRIVDINIISLVRPVEQPV